MQVSFGKILGASALLALGTACGGTSAGGGSSAGGGGMESTAGSGGASGGTGAAAGLAGMMQSTAGIGGSEAGAAGAMDVGGDAGSDTGGLGGYAGGPPVDIGPQKQATKLDVLFVVDNSVSMADKQGVLEASLPSFVSRLVNPRCVDAQGVPIATQPTTGAAACASGTRELTPVTDLHLGVITTSIGSHGGTVCSTGAATDHLDDKAQLVPSVRTSVPSFNASGFLSYDATGKAGVTDVSSVITDLKATVAAAGETGCGFEAPLEAMYRFLVDPEPPISVGLSANNSTSTPMGINDVLLAQRAAFLRPDSAVAVVILSDENDCSIRDDGVGWFVGASARMPLSTAACDTNPNDPCCRSCAQRENAPPKGCAALNEDAKCKNVPAGMQYATQDSLHDSLNLRCFNQHARFGFDLLYPVERYSNALSNPKIPNRAGRLVDNPLLVGRSATLISVATIVGTPWQDLASKASLTAGHDLEYLGGAGLATGARWPVLLGDPANNVPPSDAFMNESITPRSGENPLTHDKIIPASSLDPTANPINGHEQNVPVLDDLQYACTFPLPTPKVCPNGSSACDCAPDKSGNSNAVTAANSPVCQPPAGGAAGTTQYYAKGYPGARELRLEQLLGERAVPASICPKTLIDAASPDYAYVPAFNALLERIATTLK